MGMLYGMGACVCILETGMLKNEFNLVGFYSKRGIHSYYIENKLASPLGDCKRDLGLNPTVTRILGLV